MPSHARIIKSSSSQSSTYYKAKIMCSRTQTENDKTEQTGHELTQLFKTTDDNKA